MQKYITTEYKEKIIQKNPGLSFGVDLSEYPFPGILRVLICSMRFGWNNLEELALNQFRKEVNKPCIETLRGLDD